tara:strand:+ start:824 stop:1195 length:372 start_codon:yes stop_codon:yes gene_type:complete
MKVTITHSIDLEDVPKKTADLLEPAKEKLNNSLRWLESLCADLSQDNISAEMAALSADRIRRAMAESDIVLAEVGNILSGVAQHEREKQTDLPLTPAAVDDLDKALRELAAAKEEKNEPNMPF